MIRLVFREKHMLRSETIQSRVFPKESADFGSVIPKFVSSISTDPELKSKISSVTTRPIHEIEGK